MLVYGKCECFVMQVLYVCVLCASCGSSQCCVLHDLQFVNITSTTLSTGVIMYFLNSWAIFIHFDVIIRNLHLKIMRLQNWGLMICEASLQNGPYVARKKNCLFDLSIYLIEHISAGILVLK